jgi:hypothetical protein
MTNTHEKKNLSERRKVRSLAAFSLVFSMAAFGCTTDRHLGNGDPITTPGVRTSPTGGAATGSETAPTPPPMTSASRFDAAAATGRIQRLSPDEAAAIVAANLPRVRVLGPSSPGAPGQGYASDGRTGTFSWPALQTNPQLTVNSSISSNSVPVISSGAGEVVGGTTVTNAGGAVITNGTLSPTGAAIPVPAGAFAATTLSPTAASVVNPPASVSGSPAVAAAVTNATGVTTTQAVTPAAASAATVTPAATVSPVRLTTSASGQRSITNVSTTRATAATSSRSQ